MKPFTVAKIHNQCSAHQEMNGKILLLHTVEYYSVFKNENPTVCDDMGETEGHYTETLDAN